MKEDPNLLYKDLIALEKSYQIYFLVQNTTMQNYMEKCNKHPNSFEAMIAYSKAILRECKEYKEQVFESLDNVKNTKRGSVKVLVEQLFYD
mgnify:CR=1 FL=1